MNAYARGVLAWIGETSMRVGVPPRWLPAAVREAAYVEMVRRDPDRLLSFPPELSTLPVLDMAVTVLLREFARTFNRAEKYEFGRSTLVCWRLTEFLERVADSDHRRHLEQLVLTAGLGYWSCGWYVIDRAYRDVLVYSMPWQYQIRMSYVPHRIMCVAPYEVPGLEGKDHAWSSILRWYVFRVLERESLAEVSIEDCERNLPHVGDCHPEHFASLMIWRPELIPYAGPKALEIFNSTHRELADVHEFF